MPHPLRYQPDEWGVSFVTMRCIQSRLLLRPSERLNELIVGVIGAFIGILSATGKRRSLQVRFSQTPHCSSCTYNLTGNLSGICPECGTPIVSAGNVAT